MEAWQNGWNIRECVADMIQYFQIHFIITHHVERGKWS